MTRIAVPIAALLLAGCADTRDEPADWSDWFEGAESTWVEEEVPFTADDYALPTDSSDGIADFGARVFPVGTWDSSDPEDLWAIKYAPGEGFAEGCGSIEDDALPEQITGVVSLHPAWYIKSYGCAPDPDQSWTPDSEEKYYSSYFIEDRTGGIFVLFDSRVAPFTAGDIVTLEVQAVRSNHWADGGDYIGSQDMIYAHNIVSVERGAASVHYTDIDGPLAVEHINRVVRVSGTVVRIDENFNNYTVETDTGAEVVYSLGLDLGRRPSSKAEVGDRVQVTGPVLLSYREFTISVAQVGQLTIERGEP